MPIYEYRCDEGHTFEVMQSMVDDPLDACQVCGSPARRVLFAPAVHFKGSGFYTTDYARKGSGKATNGSEPKADAKSTSESSSDGSAASKSEGAKSESKSTGNGGNE